MSAHWRNTAYVYRRFGIDMDNLTPAAAGVLIASLASHFDMMLIQYGHTDIVGRILDSYITDCSDESGEQAERLADEIVSSDEWKSAVQEAAQDFYDNPEGGYEAVCRPVHEFMKSKGYEHQS